MKRRIGNLRGTPIIEGDKNLKTNNEIHISGLGGGSGSGNGEASTIEYLDVSGFEQASTLAKVAISVKWSDSEGGYTISPWGLFSGDDVIFKAIVIDLSIPIYNSDFPTDVNFITLGEFMTNMGMQLDSIPRITKEQFYNLET